MTIHEDGGQDIRQSCPAGEGVKLTANTSPTAYAAAGKILLTDEEGAAVFGVGIRVFLELQHAPWFPKPVLLGPRLKRHVRAELEAAVANMPRGRGSEPAQLLRGKIEKLKRTGQAA